MGSAKESERSFCGNPPKSELDAFLEGAFADKPLYKTIVSN